MSQRIVVGLDGSAESVAAAHWGAREALLRDAPLHLVHAEEC
jgi:nucleotide-binding universal stress UspA family protein